jgi:hypothetical protein
MAESQTGAVMARRPEESMNPVIMQMLSAEQGRQMREQAAAWRRTREARAAVWARPARISFALIARPLAGQRRLHGPAAA